ncbi:fukutin-like [Pecten maximus]|uniref:fukutin-like n=1 Tax=Pecten maximus TaxID=6579 RepID=UPI0014584634|nr:fukutin-like [Pecten maximus]
MKRWTLLQIALILSSVFMLIQLVIWTKFSSKEIGEPNPSRVKDVIKALMNVWDHDKGKLFLMDPDILTEYAEDKMEGQACGSFCQSQKRLVTFGVIGDVKKSLRPVFHRLRSYNFAVVDSIDEFPEFVGDTSFHVTSHVFLQNMKYPEPSVHILVLYERAAGFLWHSKIQVASSDLSFGYEAGSYKKFDLEHTVIDGISLYIPKPVEKFLDSVPQSRYIECDQKRADNFLKAHPPDVSSKAKYFQRKARQLIAQGKEVLNKLGMRFWISSGTLLGWYRQCDIITHAQDVDFGMWIKDYNSQLIHEMEKAGLPLKHVFGRINDTFELSFQAGDVKLDIFFFLTGSNGNNFVGRSLGKRKTCNQPISLPADDESRVCIRDLPGLQNVLNVSPELESPEHSCCRERKRKTCNQPTKQFGPKTGNFSFEL